MIFDRILDKLFLCAASSMTMISIIIGILWLPSWVPCKHWDLTIFHKREHGIHKRKGHSNQILRLRSQYAAIHTDPSQILKRESAIYYFFFSAHSFEETIKGYPFDFLSYFEWFTEANSSSHSVLYMFSNSENATFWW